MWTPVQLSVLRSFVFINKVKIARTTSEEVFKRHKEKRKFLAQSLNALLNATEYMTKLLNIVFMLQSIFCHPSNKGHKSWKEPPIFNKMSVLSDISQ